MGRLGEGDQRARRRLHSRVCDDHGAWELSYGLRRDRWGMGYATEAAQACLRHGFEDLGLERIVADVDPDNIASIHVLEKCGFVRAAGTDSHPIYAVTRQ